MNILGPGAVVTIVFIDIQDHNSIIAPSITLYASISQVCMPCTLQASSIHMHPIPVDDMHIPDDVG
jgi:hypothetical protein